MRISTGYENRRARIEFLPMIDVVFLLLVFFIYAMMSMVAHRGMRVELPAASSARAGASPFIDITITRDNAILLEDQAVPLVELARRVREKAGQTENLTVFVRGDVRAHLGLALGVLDRLRAAGIAEVSFATRGAAATGDDEP